MRLGVLPLASIELLALGCRPAPFEAELPRVPGSEALLFASSRIEGGVTETVVEAHAVPEDTRLPVVLAEDPAVPSNVEYEFVAAWLPGTLASNELVAGPVFPSDQAGTKRTFSELAADAELLGLDTKAPEGPATFRPIASLPSTLGALPLLARSRCLEFSRGAIITVPTREPPSFALSLPDGAAVVGFQPAPLARPRIFHLSPEGRRREVELGSAPGFQVGKSAPDGSIWLVTAALELWRASSIEVSTATAAAFVDLRRAFVPSEIPSYPADCALGAEPRSDDRGRKVVDLAVRVSGLELQSYFAMDRDGGLLVREGDRISCPFRASVRNSDVRVSVVAPTEGVAWFAADSDFFAYRYQSGEVDAFELFGSGVQVMLISFQPTIGLVATTTGRVAIARPDGGWTTHATPEISRPVAVLETPHPWANERGLFLAGDFGKAGQWWPGEPGPCRDRTEALAPSGIKFIVPLGDGTLFVAQAPPAATGDTALVWVRPEHYSSR